MELQRRTFLCGISGLAASSLLSACGSSSNDSGTVVSPFPGATPPPAPGQPRLAAIDAIKIAIAGSSSPELYLSQYAGPETSSRVLFSNDGVGYGPLETGAFGKTAGGILASETGRAVCFLRGGKSSTTIAEWSAPNSVLRTSLSRMIVAAGGVDAVLLQAGRNDAFFRQVKSVEAEAAIIRETIYRLRQETQSPNLMVFIGGVQRPNGFDQQQLSQIMMHRAAEMMVVARDPNVRYGFSTYDLPTYDGIHQTETSQNISGQRFAEQVKAWITEDEEFRGPRIVNLTAISDTETQIEFANWRSSSVFFRRAVRTIALYDHNRDIVPISAMTVRNRRSVYITHSKAAMSSRTVSYDIDSFGGNDEYIYDDSLFMLPMEPFLNL